MNDNTDFAAAFSNPVFLRRFEWLEQATERAAIVLYERNPEWYGNIFGALGDARAAILAALELEDTP